MKTLKFNIRYLLWVFIFSCFLLEGFSQEMKLSRQERKGIRNAQMAQNFVILDSLLTNKRFVLEADFLEDGYGYRAYVLSTLNFIMVDGSKGILQTGSSTRLGYNGVGGVTAKGNIGKFEISKNFKNLSYSIKFSILTNIGHYDIFLNVTSDNRATATITGLGPGRLTWEGHLATVDNSRIFKGQDTI